MCLSRKMTSMINRTKATTEAAGEVLTRPIACFLSLFLSLCRRILAAPPTRNLHIFVRTKDCVNVYDGFNGLRIVDPKSEKNRYGCDAQDFRILIIKGKFKIFIRCDEYRVETYMINN